jgi:hypothetical protein
MSRATIAPPEPETMADLWERLGRIPLERIRLHPAPGTATVEDVIRIEERENRLCELVDGTLVEKAVGAEESNIAWLIGHIIGCYLDRNPIGTCLGEAGFLRISAGLVRPRPVVHLVCETPQPEAPEEEGPAPDPGSRRRGPQRDQHAGGD